MPDPTDALAPETNSTVLPGHVLSPWRMPETFEFRRYLESSYMKIAAMAASGTPSATQKLLLDHAAKEVQSGRFKFGFRDENGLSPFMEGVNEAGNVPFMLYLSLKEKEPTITPAMAELFVTEKNIGELRLALIQLAGFSLTTPNEKKTGS